jgi:light-regulated signal transduction histidine kinase (bacteriophytochrome)
MTKKPPARKDDLVISSSQNEALARIRELERQLSESQATIQALREKLAREMVRDSETREEPTFRASEKWLFTVLEHLPVGVWLANEKGEIIYGNPAGRNIWAGAKYVGPDEFHEYKAWWYETGELIKPHDWGVARAVLHKETSLNEIIKIQCFDGSHKIILNSAVPMLSEDGEVIGAAVLNEDITTRKQSEAELEAYAEKLERSNRELEQFAFIASHDIQEPLRKIEKFGEMLLRKSGPYLDEAGRGYLDRMNEASSRMRQMISALLALYQVTSTAKPFRPVKLGEVLNIVIDDLEMRLKETGGHVRVQELPQVYADEIQMHQLFLNLIANGLKFSTQMAPPQIQVYSRSVEPLEQPVEASIFSPLRLVEVVVEDNGIGIEPDQIENVFKPFHRLHGRSEYEGFGIGLAICQKIVERHGGSITVESTPGKGSKFIVSLPAYRE